MNNKLAYILTRFPHGDVPIVNELKMLSDAGANVEIIALRKAQKTDFTRVPHQSNFKVNYIFNHETNHHRTRFWRDNLQCMLQNPVMYPVTAARSLQWRGRNFKLAAALTKALARIKPALVYVNWSWSICGSVMYACRILNIPFIFSVRGTDIDPAAKNFSLRSKTARRILTPSKGYAEILENQLYVPHEKIRLVPDSMQFEDFIKIKPRNNTDSATIRLLSVGTLRPVKRHQDLIACCDILHRDGINFKCLVFGDGPDRDKLQNLIDTLNLNAYISLENAVPRKKLIKKYEWCDIYVHTSQRESFCYAVVEAQAASRPVIATDALGGIRQSVRPGQSATLVPVGQPHRLAEEIKHLVDKPKLRTKMGQAGRKHVTKNFSIKKIKPVFLNALFQ